MMGFVKIIFLAKIREITKNKEIEFTIKENDTIRSLLTRLVQTFGSEFKNTLFDPKGELLQKIIIRLNGENIVTKEGLDTELKNNDTIIITPAVAGG